MKTHKPIQLAILTISLYCSNIISMQPHLMLHRRYPSLMPFTEKPNCSCKETASSMSSLVVPKYFEFNSMEELFSRNNYVKGPDGYIPYPEPTEHFYYSNTNSAEERISIYDRIFTPTLATNLEIVGRYGTPKTKQKYYSAMIHKATTIRYHLKYKNQNNSNGAASFLQANFYDFSGKENVPAPLLANGLYAYPMPKSPLICNEIYEKQFNDVLTRNIIIAKKFLRLYAPRNNPALYANLVKEYEEYISVMNAEREIMSYYLTKAKQDKLNDNMYYGTDFICNAEIFSLNDTPSAFDPSLSTFSSALDITFDAENAEILSLNDTLPAFDKNLPTFSSTLASYSNARTLSLNDTPPVFDSNLPTFPPALASSYNARTLSFNDTPPTFDPNLPTFSSTLNSSSNAKTTKSKQSLTKR